MSSFCVIRGGCSGGVTTTVNGVQTFIAGPFNDLEIRNGEVYVDGAPYTVNGLDKSKTNVIQHLEITCNGVLDSVRTTSGNVTVKGNAEKINTMSGRVHVDGDVSGSVSTMSGSVTASAVRGSISTMSGSVDRSLSSRRLRD